MAILVLLGIVRELNKFLEQLLPVIGWQGPAFLVVLCGGYYIWRKRAVLWESIACVISCQAWPILCCALLVAIPFAQLIGNGDLFRAVMIGNYSRDYKQAIEEMGELFGAGLLLIGAVEIVWQNRRERKLALRRPAESRECGRPSI